MSVLTTLPNVIKALSSKALGKEDTFDVPAAKALSLLTHSPRRGGRVGAGCVRLVCPALEDVFTGHRKDAASLQSPTSSASQEAWPINVEEPKPQGGSVSSVSWAVCRQRAVWLLIRPAWVREGNVLHSGGDDLGLGF